MTTVRITDAGGNKPTFVQWDVDRVLCVTGVASQPCLHFANAELKRAIVVQAEEVNGKWECKVPNFILQFACPIAVSVFTQPEGGEGRTVATAVIGVQPRMKPQDYTYEENIGYINWVQKSEEIDALLAHIQEMLDNGDLKGDPFTYEDFTPEQLAALTGPTGPCPSVVITQLPAGYRMTIYDDDGPHSFEVTSGGAYLAEDGTIVFTQPAADGNGVPNGGNAGQILRKRTNDDYDVLWEDFPGIPDGGTTGQVLKKASGTDYDAEWADEEGSTITVDDELSGTSENPVQNKIIKAALDAKGTYSKPSGGIPSSDMASAVQTSLGKADTALQSYTETDPTVPSWAKASSKPSYTASEVGAIAAPSSPTVGDFLVYTSNGWAAQSLSTWQGGSY